MNHSSVPEFIRLQNAFADHLRDPTKHPAPPDIEDRRMQIYRDLFYNNIEGFLSKGFPVLRKITDDKRWHLMVRDFFASYRCKTPYFHQICQEFLGYLDTDRQEKEESQHDPAFLRELAHYEWLELALDIDERSPKFLDEKEYEQIDTVGILDLPLSMSPLARIQGYQYPVHKIRPDFQPKEPSDQPTFLIVYRNREDKVKFVEINALTAAMLECLDQSDVSTVREALVLLAQHIQQSLDQLLPFAADLTQKFRRLDILLLGR